MGNFALVSLARLERSLSGFQGDFIEIASNSNMIWLNGIRVALINK